jgi:ribosomal protein L35
VTRRHAMKSHNLEKKSAKRKRDFRKQHTLHGSNLKSVMKLLGLD